MHKIDKFTLSLTDHIENSKYPPWKFKMATVNTIFSYVSANYFNSNSIEKSKLFVVNLNILFPQSNIISDTILDEKHTKIKYREISLSIWSGLPPFERRHFQPWHCITRHIFSIIGPRSTLLLFMCMLFISKNVIICKCVCMVSMCMLLLWTNCTNGRNTDKPY